MKPRFSSDRETFHPRIYHFLRVDVSYENIIKIQFYNTILKFINIFLIDIP